MCFPSLFSGPARVAASFPIAGSLTCPRWLLAGLLIGSAQLAHGQATSQKILRQWATLLQTYPATRDPQLLANTLAYAAAATLGEQQTLLGNQGATLGFYYTWLAEHAPERAGFRQQLAAVAASPAWHHFLLQLADTAAVPGRRGPSPTHNDFLWGAYFATGRAQYLDSVVTQCRYLVRLPNEPPRRLLLYYTSVSALWSLGANARQDEAVRAYIKNPAVRQQLANSLSGGDLTKLDAAIDQLLATL